VFCFSLIRATCPINLILLALIILIIICEEGKSRSSSFSPPSCYFIPLRFISSLFLP
jgi:hypothetical protein